MELLEFIADPSRKAALAEKTGSSPGYLWQIATSWRGKRASPDLALAIERATTEIGLGVVPRASLRPDLWGPAHAETQGTGSPQENGATAESVGEAA